MKYLEISALALIFYNQNIEERDARHSYLQKIVLFYNHDMHAADIIVYMGMSATGSDLLRIQFDRK